MKSTAFSQFDKICEKVQQLLPNCQQICS